MSAQCAPTAGGQGLTVEAGLRLATEDFDARALELGARVAANPTDLPQAVATLLGAVLVTDRVRIALHSRQTGADSTALAIRSPWTAPLVFVRPDRPFTSAEFASAHWLALVAETTAARMET